MTLVLATRACAAADLTRWALRHPCKTLRQLNNALGSE